MSQHSVTTFPFEYLTSAGFDFGGGVGWGGAVVGRWWGGGGAVVGRWWGGGVTVNCVGETTQNVHCTLFTLYLVYTVSVPCLQIVSNTLTDAQ